MDDRATAQRGKDDAHFSTAGEIIRLVAAELIARFEAAGFAHVMISLMNRADYVIEAVAGSGDLVPLVPLTRRPLFISAPDEREDILVQVVKTGAPWDVPDCE